MSVSYYTLFSPTKVQINKQINKKIGNELFLTSSAGRLAFRICRIIVISVYKKRNGYRQSKRIFLRFSFGLTAK